MFRGQNTLSTCDNMLTKLDPCCGPPSGPISLGAIRRQITTEKRSRSDLFHVGEETYYVSLRLAAYHGQTRTVDGVSPNIVFNAYMCTDLAWSQSCGAGKSIGREVGYSDKWRSKFPENGVIGNYDLELVDNPTSQALRDYFRFDRHSGVTGNYPQAELH